MLTETEPANSYVGNHQPIERYGDVSVLFFYWFMAYPESFKVSKWACSSPISKIFIVCNLPSVSLEVLNLLIVAYPAWTF